MQPAVEAMATTTAPTTDNNAVNAISVAVRIRPANAQELESAQSTQIVKALDSHVVVFDPLDAFGRERDNYRPGVPGHRKAKDLRYAFDRVFSHTATQAEVYAGTTQPLLEALLDGFNCSVFAYGATGAGKTHTMLGYHNDPGVMVLTMKELFERIETMRSHRTIQVSVSMMEIYNETLRDLLLPNGQRSPALDVREDADGSVAVPGLSEHEPKDASEILDLLARGNSNRTVSSTNVNATSSRSHAVLQIRMRQRDRATGVAATIRTSKLSMIDLAGSERASATKNSGERLVEGANINKSLLALGNCINALGDPTKKGGFVPYRDSKLTRLLKDSLGGNCRTVMIANVSPSALHYEDTHNTLKYANRAKEIKMKLDQNIVSVDYHINAYTTVIRELQDQVAALKEQLSRTQPSVASAEAGFGEVFQQLQPRLADLSTVYEHLVAQHATLWSQMHQSLWAHETATWGMPVTGGDATTSATLQQLHVVEQQLAKHEVLMEQWLNEQAPSLSATEVEFCRLQLLSKVHFSRRQAIEGQLQLTLGHCDKITGYASDLSQRFRQISGALQQQPREVLALCNIDPALMRWPAQSQSLSSRPSSPRKDMDEHMDAISAPASQATAPIAQLFVPAVAAVEDNKPQRQPLPSSPRKMMSRPAQAQRHSPYARRAVAVPLAPEAPAQANDVEIGRHNLRNTAARRRSMLPVLSADAKRRDSVSVQRVPLGDVENLSRDAARGKGAALKTDIVRQARRGSLLPQPVWN